MTVPETHGRSQPRLDIDPVRFEVMRSALESAANEMGGALRRSAYSTNIKTRGDFSCAIFDADMRVIAQSFSQPIHLASMARMVPRAVEMYGPDRLQEGDAIVFNDPHQGAMHLNDIAVITPVDHAGVRVGYTAAVAHHVDIGGMAPGGLAMSTDVYQEGLIIPPTRLMAQGAIDANIFNLITANIRAPKQMSGDFRAQIASTLLGRRRVVEFCRRFGADQIAVFTREFIRYTQTWTAAELRKLPEGVYRAEGYLDDDGMTDTPIKLVVQVAVKDGGLLFDLTGCDAQRPSPMNANTTYAYAAMSYVAKCLIDPEIPANGGFYAQVQMTVPPGTVVSAQPPAGVVGGGEVSMRLIDLAFKALSEAVPDRITACGKSSMCQIGAGGVDPRSGEVYTCYETLAGGYGARAMKDGLDAVQAHFQNTENAAVEETENNLPIRVLRYALVPDSEGAGRFRGGLGLRRDWQFVDHEATFSVLADHRVNRPWGLFGGEAASSASMILNPDGEARPLKTKMTMKLPRDAVISYRTPGGGGYGPAWLRDPQAVLDDVVQGKISQHRARDVYKVVIDEATGTIDFLETEKRRKAGLSS